MFQCTRLGPVAISPIITMVVAMTLRIDLSPDQEAWLREQAEAAGVSAEEFAREALGQALADSESDRKPSGSRTMSERIRAIWADMPEEVREGLPADGAAEHDHYIYGWPKKGA